MEVFPISIPKIDWNTYILMYKECFGHSPVAGLDSAGMDLDVPASFIATLDFENPTSPMDVLRKAAKTMLLEHSFCSFVYIGDPTVLQQPPTLRALNVVQKEFKRNTVFAILTGNIFQWNQALWAAPFYEDKDYTEFVTIIKSFLYQAGFKEALL